MLEELYLQGIICLIYKSSQKHFIYSQFPKYITICKLQNMWLG